MLTDDPVERSVGHDPSAAFDDTLNKVPRELFIGGQWRGATNDGLFAIENPATAETLLRVADADPDDALTALDLACSSQGQWANAAPRFRGEILRRTYELMVERVDELAVLVTLEMGKPLPESRAEVLYAAEYFRWFGEQSVRIEGHFGTSPDGASTVMVRRQAVGPCLLITPWNFPLAMGARKIAPAVAAGCTMLVKPAKQTPLSMLALTALLDEAGLPAGVLSVLPTLRSSELVAAVMRDRRLRKVSFTGSTRVGQTLIKQSAPGVLRTSMELGGNAPFLVFDDADLEEAVSGAMQAKMRNMGQACTAANRFLVHERVAPAFTDLLVERMSELQVGPGLDPGTHVGPMIDSSAREGVIRLVNEARHAGATVEVGGESPGGRGYFLEPTVVTDVSPDSRLFAEEIFGPVAPIATFRTDEEAVQAANATEYGLVAYAFTQSWSRAHKLCEALEVGMVGLNTGIVSNAAAPFGGLKSSGFGREGGTEGIDEYLEVKYISTPRLAVG